MPEDLFSTADAAAYCEMPVDRFKHYIRTEQVKPAMRAGKVLVWNRAELDRFKAAPKSGPGRPRLSTVKVTLRLSPEVAERLTARAEEAGVTPDSLAEAALRHHLGLASD